MSWLVAIPVVGWSLQGVGPWFIAAINRILLPILACLKNIKEKHNQCNAACFISIPPVPTSETKELVKLPGTSRHTNIAGKALSEMSDQIELFIQWKFSSVLD